MSDTLTIDGSVIDRAAAEIQITRCSPFAKGGIPSLTLVRRGIALAALPDAYAAKSVSWAPAGTTIFAGDVASHAEAEQVPEIE